MKHTYMEWLGFVFAPSVKHRHDLMFNGKAAKHLFWCIWKY